ncbi:hypothetical protein PHYSODRAFT_494709 [Phytophthora sojae]|uniref:FYVE-type domain-containing protein n=1 Tax=Phytophthora sojae (strain P6497) TaxID=1094619 RepID=G4Z4P6_PHYSP|nr:hypothetical protein PHYSODRAFT_494709 [Phytophthora sojae]EGZ21583.1 hypothetical protein PHYSODRAFT_494709 [Phytophthora sojae]|eukprot:XP_009524300.1 hypothetical protein PHYSODRAFT_494709 [Phytophthora sojae]
MFDPDQQCPQIEFAPEDRAQYGHAALRLLQNTMAERTKFNADPQDWAFIKHRKEFSIFRSVRGSANQSTVVMVGTGLIDGRIEDILEGLYCGTTHELRNARVLLGYDVKGISVPNSHERLTQDDPFLFASTKSLVGKCALKLVYERDALTYERVGTTTDARGQELTYHTVQPIKRPEWPSERQDIASCYLSRQDKFTNKTEVFLWGSILRFGSDPEEAIQLGVASTWLNVVRSPDVGHAKKYSALMDEADSHQRMPSSINCHVCCRNKPKLGSHALCSGCHQSVCKDCSEQHYIFELSKSGRTRRRLFCAMCIKDVTGKAHLGSGSDLSKHSTCGPDSASSSSRWSESLFQPHIQLT